MNITDWAQRHHRSILFALACIGLAGIVSAWSLPVGLFPQVSFPRVQVSLDAGDRPAERMAIEVTRPVEDAVRSVPGVRSVRSTTSRGTADVSINFDWGLDMISATLQIESAINQVINGLPAGIQFEVRRMDPTVFPIVGYSLTSDQQSLVTLRDLALYQIRPALSTITGVARIDVLGGETEEYQVIVDPGRLQAFDLSLQDVANALSASNILTAVGRLEENNKLYLVFSNTRIESFKEIEETILRSGKNGFVRVEDVATVQKGVAPRWTRVTAAGQDAVLFQVYQQPDGNSVAIVKSEDEHLKILEKTLPENIHIAKWYDQSDLVIASALSVRDALWIGVALAAIVLFLFLKNWRVTLIAVIAVPLVLATTVLVLKLMGMSFNIMTLGGMAAAVALIVDDAIVMIEHIIRRVRGSKAAYHERVLFAASEFTRPLAGSSASTIIIFAPLAFLSGVTGAFFKALSLTMAAGLIVSFLVAWLVVPLLALHLLRPRDTQTEEGGWLFDRLQGLYRRSMTVILKHPGWIVFLMIAPLLGTGYWASRHVGSEFMPAMDEGGFILDYRAPSGTSLSETDRLLRQVEQILKETPEVLTYSRRTGLALGGFITEANEGDFFIRLKPFPRKGLDEVMDDIRARIEMGVPGVAIEMAKLMADVIGDLTAVPQPIEIKLFSDDGLLLEALAPHVAEKLQTISGVVDVKDGIVLAGDAMDIKIDRVKAAIEGINPDQVTQMMDHALSGIVTTALQQDPKMINVRVWTHPENRTFESDLAALSLRATDGHLVPLSRIAQIHAVVGQPQITRENLKRMVAVTGQISGRDMGSTVQDVLTMLQEPGLLPNTVYYQLGGLYEQQQIAFRGLIAVFGAAVALVFTLLLFLYERYLVAIAMLATSLLAVAPVFVGLWLTHTDLNITAMMGMTMIVGIVTEVAIFHYSEFADLPDEGTLQERLILAGQHRMRPIAMTTLAAILALSPLALGLGEGAAMLQPLAIAIISGLSVQMPLVLVGLPALLLILRALRSPKKPEKDSPSEIAQSA